VNTFYSKGSVLFTVFYVNTVKSKTLKYYDFGCIYSIDCFTVEENFNLIYIQKTLSTVFYVLYATQYYKQ